MQFRGRRSVVNLRFIGLIRVLDILRLRRLSAFHLRRFFDIFHLRSCLSIYAFVLHSLRFDILDRLIFFHERLDGDKLPLSITVHSTVHETVQLILLLRYRSLKRGGQAI